MLAPRFDTGEENEAASPAYLYDLDHVAPVEPCGYCPTYVGGVGPIVLGLDSLTADTNIAFDCLHCPPHFRLHLFGHRVAHHTTRYSKAGDGRVLVAYSHHDSHNTAGGSINHGHSPVRELVLVGHLPASVVMLVVNAKGYIISLD